MHQPSFVASFSFGRLAAQGMGFGLAIVMLWNAPRAQGQALMSARGSSSGSLGCSGSSDSMRYQQARRMAIENHLLYIQAYFEGRQMNRQYREMERSPRATSEELAAIAHSQAPRRLDSSEYDRHTGQVNWPLALQSDTFSSERRAIEFLLLDWADNPESRTIANYQSIARISGEMKGTLVAHIHDLPSGDYMTARSFLRSLPREAHGAERDE